MRFGNSAIPRITSICTGIMVAPVVRPLLMETASTSSVSRECCIACGASDGQLVWKCDTARKFGVIQNFFGVGSTPVVAGDLLVCIVGGSPENDRSIAPGQLDRVSGNGCGVVAFDKWSGEVRYKISDELAGYASPVVARIGQRDWCFAFCRGGLLAFEPQSGAIDFHYAWRSQKLESVNASGPVVVGDEVFISETYGPGSSLLRVRPGDYEIVWRDELRRRKKSLQAHWNTPIHHAGYLYGCSGRNPPDAELRCVEWKSGNVMWSEPTGSRSSLLYVDGHFVCLDERGKLQLIKANPRRLEVIAEVELRDTAPDRLSSGLPPRRLLQSPCWAAPILSHGLLYVRGRDRLVCLELIPQRDGSRSSRPTGDPGLYRPRPAFADWARRSTAQQGVKRLFGFVE